jgi:RimJ/RimL family protein N-acetyltransferase
MGHFGPIEYAMKPAGVGPGSGVGAGRCVVRSASGADAGPILECAAETFRTTMFTLTQADEFTLTVEQEREFLTGIERQADQVFLIAVDAETVQAGRGATHSGGDALRDGDVLGVLILRRALPKRKLSHTVELGMSVRSTHRARGVGTALLDAGIRWARTVPTLRMITLGVYAENAAGIALYRRMGFVQHGYLPGGCRHDDGSEWDQVQMYLRL